MWLRQQRTGLQCRRPRFNPWVGGGAGGGDPLEKGMATHSRILAWRIPWTEEPKGYNPWGHKELYMTEQLTLHFNPEY